MLEILKYFYFFLNIDKQFLAFFSDVLCVIMTIVAEFLFLSGVCIILFTDILYLAKSISYRR